MPTNEEQASLIADSLPVCGDDDDEGDLISLCDIVVTGIEVPEEWRHFWVRLYNPGASGENTDQAWAYIDPMPSAGDTKPDGTPIRPVALTSTRVRQAVYEYLLSRLNAGMDLSEARQLVDGSYTDAVIADSILQFALYGQEVYS